MRPRSIGARWSPKIGHPVRRMLVGVTGPKMAWPTHRAFTPKPLGINEVSSGSREAIEHLGDGPPRPPKSDPPYRCQTHLKNRPPCVVIGGPNSGTGKYWSIRGSLCSKSYRKKKESGAAQKRSATLWRWLISRPPNCGPAK